MVVHTMREGEVAAVNVPGTGVGENHPHTVGYLYITSLEEGESFVPEIWMERAEIY